MAAPFEIDLSELAWFNVAEPLGQADLRGRLLILDFWTFCCINCIQTLPALRRVEEAFRREVLVIGVHSPKFDAEKDPTNLAHAIARYGITHPVVHDPDLRLWRRYGVRAWPTLVLIAPDGSLLGQIAGEPEPEQLLSLVGRMLGPERGRTAPAALPLISPSWLAQPSRLHFPGKIKRLGEAPGKQRWGERGWAVADSGHQQIVLFDDHGNELCRFGSGEAGFRDGPSEEASFRAPQGLICDGSVIYVADTGNHALRRIDLASGEIATLAGTGQRGTLLDRPTPARAAALASPWDLELVGASLVFANSGSHQLGVFDLKRATVAALAGTGAEGIADGPAEQAVLAQPSGLALDSSGKRIYFADSESSAIRVLLLSPQPVVRTLVGQGLFHFGHVNGPLTESRFQHPLGLACTGRQLVVADSYNGALRLVDEQAERVEDLEDAALVCEDTVCLPLAEPAGVAADGPSRLLVADTNNHRILEYRLDKGRYGSWAGSRLVS